MHFPTILLSTLPLLSSLVSSYAIPTPNALTLSPRDAPDSSEGVPFPFEESHGPVLEDIFGKIEAIPDDILDQGQAATAEWLKANSNLVTRDVSVIEERQGWVAVAKCAFEIGKAIVETQFPIAKLRRFKELISLLGGAKKVAKMLLKAKSIKQFIIIGGPELAEIGEILLGLQGVASACFSWI